jgi:hypothetical protein
MTELVKARNAEVKGDASAIGAPPTKDRFVGVSAARSLWQLLLFCDSNGVDLELEFIKMVEGRS